MATEITAICLTLHSQAWRALFAVAPDHSTDTRTKRETKIETYGRGLPRATQRYCLSTSCLPGKNGLRTAILADPVRKITSTTARLNTIPV